MNLNKFDAIYEAGKPFQRATEWRLFLEFVEAYFINRDIRSPIVVELGVAKNFQKSFYVELLGAEHIGIDHAARHNPDIVGDTHSSETVSRLKDRLAGRPINLLFVDAGHLYDDVKLDYEMYDPLTKNIVVFHDAIHNDPKHQVRILWEEIMREEAKYAKILFSQKISYMGIGLIIKE